MSLVGNPERSASSDKLRAPWRWSVSDDRRCTVIYNAEDQQVAWLTDDDVADHICGLVNLEHVRSAMQEGDFSYDRVAISHGSVGNHQPTQEGQK